MLKKTIPFPILGDERGSLIALENHKQIPFVIQRVYYIFDTKAGVRRGFHAHKALEQVVICLTGSCKFLLDDGKTQENFTLDKNTEGLFLGSMLWREMYDFSADCVLMVLASELYNEADYIRDYQEFLKQVNHENPSFK